MSVVSIVNRKGAIRQNVVGEVGYRESLLCAFTVLITRFGVLAIIAFLVKGQEFCDDVRMHMSMVRAPLYLLLGVSAGPDTLQHPPFLGLMEGFFAYPLQIVLPDFYAIRITYIVYESLTAFFFLLVLQRVVPGSRTRFLLAAAFVVVPMGWITTAVRAQDEVIATFFLVIVLWLLSIGRTRGALLTCGFGVVAAKIFLAVPLAALVLLPLNKKLCSRALTGLAPIVVTYLWTALAALLHGASPIPLAGFIPNNTFGVNVWVIMVQQLVVTPGSARFWSSLLALAGALVPLLVLGTRGVVPDTQRMVSIFAAMLLWVFVFFYHVNPEYYLMLTPLLLIMFRSKLELGILALFLTVPWVVNFFYGIQKNMTLGQPVGGGKGALLGIYGHFFSVNPALLHAFSLWLCILLTFCFALTATVKSLQKADRP